MHGRRVTQLDVAQHAGVSRTTASFVLSGRDDMRISDAARERVLRAARALDYRPNLTARALRTKITHTIALISDTIATEPYAGRVVQGALSAASGHGHVLLVGETEGDGSVESRLVDNFLDRQVDHFLYASMFTRRTAIPAQLRGPRVVLVNCSPDGFTAPSVIPDERSGGRTAANALLDAGHRHGIYLVGEAAPEVFAWRERVSGITSALAARGVELAGHVPCSWQPADAFEDVRALLRSDSVVTGLICLNDRIALGAYQAIEAVGLTVPADVSVVSFDDSELAGWLRPGLTSVALPHFEMGRLGVETLLAADGAPTVHRIAMPLHRRSSIAGPSRRRGGAADQRLPR